MWKYRDGIYGVFEAEVFHVKPKWLRRCFLSVRKSLDFYPVIWMFRAGILDIHDQWGLGFLS